ncbi:hypothetical protein [Anaerosolibacter sp.]|uniref:hypothetical protein n=1 Tax=Anaerosolibacter sp. TaxID=1872527 RepID=UPI0039F1481A
MPRFLGILLIILGVFSLVTYLLHRFFKNKYIKYIPTVAALIFAVYNFYGARMLPAEGFQDLARVILGVMLMAGFLSGIATGVIIDYIIPIRNRKKVG